MGYFTAAALALALDALVGDPVGFPHIVVFFGRVIHYLDQGLNRREDQVIIRRLKGLLLVICLSALAILPTLLILWILPEPLEFIFSVVLLWYCLALKTLKTEALMTAKGLQISLDTGRKRLSRIVGRQTGDLTETGVIMAVIETVAENTSDGVIAPLFYGLLFGPAGALFYKAVNTMDSMIAYKNAKYGEFGYFAAKLDDLLNLLPSRITGLLAVLTSPGVGGDIGEAWKVFLKDRNKHDSPNSGQCESAFAGALDVVLGGPAVYEGEVSPKPYLNEKGRQPKVSDIQRGVDLMYLVTGACFLGAGMIKLGWWLIWMG